MSNYPPGVTGNEWQIAGPDERVVSVDCNVDGCGFTGEVDGSSIDGETWQFTCPDCGTTDEWLIEDDRP